MQQSSIRYSTATNKYMSKITSENKFFKLKMHPRTLHIINILVASHLEIERNSMT